MRKKLILLISFVLVLGLAAGVAKAAPYQQDPGPDGILSIEAENFDKYTQQDGYAWQFLTEPAGFSGTGLMRAVPDDGGARSDDYAIGSPRLDFEVNFVKTGTHYVWVRSYRFGSNDEYGHVGLDGDASTSDHVRTGTPDGKYEWYNDRTGGRGLTTVEVTSAGLHTINVWMGESGWGVDKLVLTTNPDFTLTGTELGPPESLRGARTKAFNASPADGATDVPRDAVLSWAPGEFASPTNGHKVYLSENFNDVNDGIGGVTQNANSYAPGRLDFSATYYWRVDEVNGPPDYTVYEGDVWSFTTEPFAYPIENVTATASSASQAKMGPENTINGSGLDDNDLHSNKEKDMWLSSTEPSGAWIQYEFDKVYKLHQMWVWNSNQTVESFLGFGFKDVTIDYSTNGTDYTTLGTTHQFARAPGAAGYAYNTTIDFTGVGAKYVRLTANSNWGGIMPQYGLSEVRFFYIPVQAREPRPADGKTDVSIGTIDMPIDVTLGFRAGREAAKHDVYFSVDQQAVIDGTAPVTTVAEASYGPLSLDLGMTYYWKINEVNMAETPTTWESEVWNFTTRQFLVVDDFESYNDLDTTDPESNRIFNTWIDGYGVPTNGSIVGYENPPFCEKTIVHSNKQSMPFAYDNTGGVAYSEAERTFAVGQNWTKAGVQTLVLYFHGTAGNTGQLYVKINGSKVVYGGDAADIATPQWKRWNIDLAPLGASMQNVTKLSIGIDGNGASGKLFFDDIRLYRMAPEQ
jgi:hypothetical protein